MTDPRVLGLPDRRRPGPRPHSPVQTLEDMPSLILFERLPEPLVAVDDNGAIAYANDAFATMVGYPRDAVTTMSMTTLLTAVPLGNVGVVAALRARAGSVVQLLHAEGWTVSAVMSDSALRRHDDPVAVMTFADISEQLWVAEPPTGPSAPSHYAFAAQRAAR